MIYIFVDVGDIGSSYRLKRQYSGYISIPSFFGYELPVMQRRREYMCGGGMNVRKGGSAFFVYTF
jgi:hypothetical protein